jgi:hypothetical protein
MNSKVGIQNGEIRIYENALITEICAHLDPVIEIVRKKGSCGSRICKMAIMNSPILCYRISEL